MPPEVISALGVASAFIIGILGWVTGWRTLQASKKKDEHARDEALFARYERGWTAADGRAERFGQRVDELSEKVEGLTEKVDEYRAELERFKAAISSAVAYIQRLLEILRLLGAAHPPIPRDIAHLFDEPADERGSV